MQILYMTDRYAVSLTTRPVKHRRCYAKLRLGPGPYRARGVGWIGYATLTTCCSDMATKRSASTSVSASQAPLKKTKRQVTVLTFRKWQTNYEQEHQALSWLCCDVDEGDKSLVGLLWCSVCRRFEERIRGVKISPMSGSPVQPTISPVMSSIMLVVNNIKPPWDVCVWNKQLLRKPP